MSVSISTGLKSALLTLSGFQSIMDGGVIEVYQGARPASPDDAHSAILLGRVTQDGNAWAPLVSNGGLKLVMEMQGVLSKSGNWMFTGSAAGTAEWFRFYWPANDDRTTSTFYPRLDGDVGPDLILANTAITNGLQFYVDEFTLTF